jgi:hypothetical protein
MASQRDHDPDSCKDGEGCKPCVAAEQKAKILDLARERSRTVRRPTEAQRRDALGLALRQAGASLAGLLLVLVAGCAPVGVAADAARQQALLCAGNATGPGRCQEVRNVEADNAVCWDAQVFTLTGEHALPPEVLAEVASVVSR